MYIKRFLLLLAVLPLASVSFAETMDFSDNNCQSTTESFGVACPPHWYLLFASATSIDLLSFPASESLEGTIIKDGGAEITVESAPAEISNVESWVAADRKLVDASRPVSLRSWVDHHRA